MTSTTSAPSIPICYKPSSPKGNNGLLKRKYITFGIEADSLRAAKPKLERIEADILNNFKSLGVKTEPLSGYERLKVLHDAEYFPLFRSSAVRSSASPVSTGLHQSAGHQHELLEEENPLTLKIRLHPLHV